MTATPAATTTTTKMTIAAAARRPAWPSSATAPPDQPATPAPAAAARRTRTPRLLATFLPPGAPVVVAHVDVPAGQYVVKAKGECSSAIEAGTGQIQCRLVATSGTADVDSQRTV